MIALLLVLIAYVFPLAAQQGGGGAGYTIDGTVTPTIINHVYQFAPGNSAAGAVYFKRGFNVPAGAAVVLNICWPIDGSINLNGTGMLSIDDHSGGLRLGPNFSGFTNGGIIQATNSTVTHLSLDSDITVAGQLKFLNETVINCNKHTITMASGTTSRGSIILDEGVTARFNSGALINAQDFTTGYGPRFRGTNENSGYVFDSMDIVLIGDSAMTCTGVTLGFQGGPTTIRTTNKSTIKVYDSFDLGPYVNLYLRPGISLLFNPRFGATVGGNQYVGLFLDSARLLFTPGAGTLVIPYGGTVFVDGNSAFASATDENVQYGLGLNVSLDIAPRARLTLDRIDFVDNNL
jgi:hypothetical protein